MSSTIPAGGKIIAIYDLVWKAELGDEVKVRTQYNGERIHFKIQPVQVSITNATDPTSPEYEHRAMLKYRIFEDSYPCPTSLFQNFDILALPPPQPFPILLSPNATNSLILKFIDVNDDEGYPFLCFRITAKIGEERKLGREQDMCVIGWAKRREYDDEVVDLGNLTRLTEGERERLIQRGEVDMLRLEGIEEGEVTG